MSSSKILLRTKKGAEANKSCGICGKKLKNFKRTASENPLSCWKCIILNANS